MACTDLGRGRGKMAKSWTGGGGGLGVGDMAKISLFFFRNITIHNFITILCHVGFSILQVV